MVYFVCSKCQETLRKNQVEGHSHSCHNESFSCVDCNKVFDLQTYKDHKVCISEEEKYQGKLYNPKKVKENPQLEWMKLLDEAKDTCTDPPIKHALEQLCNLDNVPRKKKQFYNYVNNCVHLSTSVVDKVWNVLEEIRQKQLEEKKAIEEKIKAENAAKKKEKENQKQNESSSSSSWDTSSSSEDEKSKTPKKDEKSKSSKKEEKSKKESHMKLKEKKHKENTEPKKKTFKWKKQIKMALQKPIKFNSLRDSIIEKAMNEDTSLQTDKATKEFYKAISDLDLTIQI